MCLFSVFGQMMHIIEVNDGRGELNQCSSVKCRIICRIKVNQTFKPCRCLQQNVTENRRRDSLITNSSVSMKLMTGTAHSAAEGN